jgi:hypothetical protein
MTKPTNLLGKSIRREMEEDFAEIFQQGADGREARKSLEEWRKVEGVWKKKQP